MTTFDDPGLRYGAALSKLVGRVVMRVADADLPVTRYGDFADTVREVPEGGRQARRRPPRRGPQARAAGRGRRVPARQRPAQAGRRARPGGADPAPELAALEDAADDLKQAADRFDKALADRGAGLDPARRAKVMAQLRDIDQLLLDPKGLPDRPWYQNLVYAPGRFTGYGAKTLPGVREAIEERRFADATEYAGRTAKVLRAYAGRLDQARATVEGR